MLFDIDARLRELLDSDPGSAEAVNIRICRHLHPDLRLLKLGSGSIISCSSDIWGYPLSDLCLELVPEDSGVVTAQVWASEHQYRVYADAGAVVATFNPSGFGWVPTSTWAPDLRSRGWPEDFISRVDNLLKRNPPINW